MTRVELIRAVADALTNLDVLRFDLDLDDPERPRLYAQRKELDALLDTLVDAQIDAGTPIFAEASEELGLLNEELKATSDDLSKLKKALDTVNKVLDIVKQVVGTALPLIPIP
jgi:predicted nuclease with TOPRIM domain